MKLFKLINAWGTTVVIATHDKSLLNFHPTKVIVLEKGQVREVFTSNRKASEADVPRRAH
jgi:ABC-type ATPase involved in cell division